MRRIINDTGLTPRCAVLIVLAVAALVAAPDVAEWLYGISVCSAFAAGTQWYREVSCDGCGAPLETSEPEPTTATAP